MTQMLQTSLSAFYELKDSGRLGERQEQVFQAINKYSPITNTELSTILKLPINCVTGRVKELRDYGLVMEKGKRKCNITGKMCYVWGKKQ